MRRMTLAFRDADHAVDWLCAQLGADLRVAAPLGLGKPNALLNALYARLRGDPSRRLTLFTALSLNPPRPGAGVERAFLEPFARRHWGDDYPRLAYADDAAANRLPKNVRVHEFYTQAGQYLRAPQMQHDYVSVNYTHVAETVLRTGVRAVVQLVARRGDRYSLSCNPDLTLDLVDLYRESRTPLHVIAAVHPDLPFMGGDAEVGEDFFAGVVDAAPHALFALPRAPIDLRDHWIGLHVSTLIEDDGTLQVGIGSLSDAVVAALLLRHRQNALYREVTGAALGAFEAGLYGLSEMVTDGFMHLRRAGILRREVRDGAASTFLHGAFFLGSKEFYAWLRDMPDDEARGVRMTRVSKVNDLYDANELLLRRQRTRARCLNTCMQATLLGAAASETLEDGRVISGVGGQYNFVAMAQELRGGRSVLMLRATREEDGARRSNVVWGHEMLTIPRHLRDVVVTEYGVAELRGRTDEDCIRAMLGITDAAFQRELAQRAIDAGKLSSWTPRPENTPERLEDDARRWRAQGLFATFPFGSDFTPVEERLAVALGRLKTMSGPQRARAALRGATQRGFSEELARVGLDRATSVRDRLTRAALRDVLSGR